MALEKLIRDNIETLAQAQDLLHRLAASKVDFGARIGPHLRHVLDHYDCFFSGLEAGCVDYDARDRDADCETNPGNAAQRIERAMADLESLNLSRLPKTIRVRLATDPEQDAEETCSSVDRELQFLLSHAVHHYALIGFIAEQLGLTFDSGFGKAPSTLQFEREQALA